MGIWHLSLTAVSKDVAEDVKSFAAELDIEYGFQPYDANSLTGLEYIDMGILYRHGNPDCLRSFFRFAEQVSSHFADVELIYTEFNSDNQGLYTYRSRDGKLQRTKECTIELYAADEFASGRQRVVSILGEEGLAFDDVSGIISFTYDALTEQGMPDRILDSISKLFPETEIVCLKATDDCCEAPYDSFCIIRDGVYEWRELDYNMNQIMMTTCWPGQEIDDYEKIKRFEVVKDPVAAVGRLLDKIRKGEAASSDEWSVASMLLDESEYQNDCLALLMLEDEQWLGQYRDSAGL